MKRTSFAHILSRTFDYLARRHPWFDAIHRRRGVAAAMLLGYGGLVLLVAWQVHGGKDDGWVELMKTYSALFFDLLVLFLLSVVFLLVRGYYLEERTRIDTSLLPDKRYFLPFNASSVEVQVDGDGFFQRHPAVTAILDALPMDQSDFFLAHAGSLDIPKLTLRRLQLQPDGSVRLDLGVAAFREFFFTHHFADYSLSRSSSRDAGQKESLRSLFAPVYERQYARFFDGAVDTLTPLGYTPNTLGVTGCVRVMSRGKVAYFLQRRGYHESAARGVLQLSYAGTLNAYPLYADHTEPITLQMLADDEFQDEFMAGEPGRWLRGCMAGDRVTHELVGLCANSQYLFQPELFVLSTIIVDSDGRVDALLAEFAPKKAARFLALPSLDTLESCFEDTQLKMRPLCRIAVETIYRPWLNAAV
jgi:hypothetical protein